MVCHTLSQNLIYKEDKRQFKKTFIKLFITLFTIVGLLCAVSFIITSLINACADHRYEPNRETCDCSCWDGFNKGCYLRNDSSSSYKHIYINSTSQSFMMILWTLLYFTMFIRILERIIYNLIFKFNLLDFLALSPIIG